MKTFQWPAATMLAVAAGLTGCGGGGDASATTPVLSTLLSDDGQPTASMPQAVPVDAGARTRPGLYALRGQVESMERAMPGATISVSVASNDAGAVDLAVLTAYGLQAAADLPSDAPVFVQGADLRQAAAAVNRLADGGMTRVYLVTD